MTDLHRLSIREISEGLAAAKFSSRELTEHYLKRIAKIDPQVRSYVTVTNEVALAQADAADAIRQAGQATALTGVPVAHKDIFCTQGIKTSAGSKMLDNFISPYDATVVAQGKNAGLVTLGKVNMDEFAMVQPLKVHSTVQQKTPGHLTMYRVVHQVVRLQSWRLI